MITSWQDFYSEHEFKESVSEDSQKAFNEAMIKLETLRGRTDYSSECSTSEDAAKLLCRLHSQKQVDEKATWLSSKREEAYVRIMKPRIESGDRFPPAKTDSQSETARWAKVKSRDYKVGF